jgi:hypothetical protein
MRRSILSYFLLISLACGTVPVSEPIVYGRLRHLETVNSPMDSAIWAYVYDFITDCKRFHTDEMCHSNFNMIDYIGFATDKYVMNDDLVANGNRLAICERINIGTSQEIRRVTIISRDYEYTRLKMIVYHELGHCMLNADHQLTGLMSSPLISTQSAIDHWDEFVVQLFTKDFTNPEEN